MGHINIYIYISNTPKYIIECYICRKRERENTCKFFFSFLKGKNFLQQISENKLQIILHYKIFIYSHALYESINSLQIISR